MKTALLTLSLMLAVNANISAQDRPARLIDVPVQYAKDNAPTLALVFLAGVFDAHTEIIRSDYKAFKEVFPGANDKWWNPAISHRNKWKNGDPANGPAFWQSTGVLVGLTDAHHALRGADNACWLVAFSLKIGEKPNLKDILVDIAAHWAANKVGFNLTYHGLYKHQF